MTKSQLTDRGVFATLESCRDDEEAWLRGLVEKVKQMPDIRAHKVRQMQRLIVLKRLETPERLAGTAQRLVEELGI